MTALSDIIYRAYRELFLLDENEHLTRNQMNDGVARLNSLIKSFYGYEAGEPLDDWPLGDYGRENQSIMGLSDQEILRPPINSRLIHTATAAKTVYLDPRPSDGSRYAISDPHGRLATYNITLDGNGRTIAGAATVVLSTDNLDRTYFYRADQSSWVQVSDLAATDAMPFPEEFDTMFIVFLSFRVAPAQADGLPAATVNAANRLQMKFTNRYLQRRNLEVNPDIGKHRMTNQSGGTASYSNTDFFNRGSI